MTGVRDQGLGMMITCPAGHKKLFTLTPDPQTLNPDP